MISTGLEKEARKALRSVPKIVFEHSKEGAEKAAVFGKVWTVLWCPQNVVATSKGWDKVALKWDPCCCCEEGKKCGYKAEVKKEEEDSSKYTAAYEGEEEGCTVSGLQSDTVYAFRVCGWLEGDESDCGREWSDAVMARTQKIPVPKNITAKSEITWDSITLSWDAVEGASSYQIEVDGSKTRDASTTNTFTKTGLQQDTEYSFRVRTVCGNEVSE